MSRKVYLLLLSLSASLALLSCQQAPPPTNTAENTATPQMETAKKRAVTDLEALSNRLITQVAGVKEGEIVFINGGVRDMELLENIATDVRKVGAYPLLTVGSDRMFKKYYEEVPDKYDAQPPDLDLKLATLPAVTIGVDANESDDVAAGISPARMAAVATTSRSVTPIWRTSDSHLK